MRANAPTAYARFFGDPPPESALVAPAGPADHVAFFADHSTVADRRTILDVAADRRPARPTAPRTGFGRAASSPGARTPGRLIPPPGPPGRPGCAPGGEFG